MALLLLCGCSSIPPLAAHARAVVVEPRPGERCLQSCERVRGQDEQVTDCGTTTADEALARHWSTKVLAYCLLNDRAAP